MYSPMLYSMAFPFIHSVYKSLHLLTPTSHSILAPTLFPSETTSPPKCPLTGEWMEKKNKLWYVHIMGYWKWKVKSLSRVWLFVTPWTVAYQVPPSTVFSRKEYWSGLPFPSPNRILGSNKKRTKYWFMQQHWWISGAVLSERSQTQNNTYHLVPSILTFRQN